MADSTTEAPPTGLNPGDDEPPEEIEVDDPRDPTPKSVKLAYDGQVKDPGEVEIDATEWLLEAPANASEVNVEPTTIWIKHNGTKIPWRVVPLPGDEFRKFRAMAMPNRTTRRAAMQGVGAAMEMDDTKYHLLVVTAATVSPDIRAVARSKGVADPAEVVRHRFMDKPGWLSQISGVVSDISGFDESEIEVAAGNS